MAAQLWVATFGRFWWSRDLVFIRASTEDEALAALRRAKPALADRPVKIVAATPAMAAIAEQRHPLARRRTIIDASTLPD